MSEERSQAGEAVLGEDGVFGWSTADLANGTLVPLEPIPPAYHSLAHWQRTFQPYLLEDFRATLHQEQSQIEYDSYSIVFDQGHVTFTIDLDPETVESFRNGVCLLSGSRFESILAVLGTPAKDRGRIVKPVSFNVSFMGEYPNGSFDSLRLLGPFAPTERAYRKLTELSEENSPTFISDILTGI